MASKTQDSQRLKKKMAIAWLLWNFSIHLEYHVISNDFCFPRLEIIQGWQLKSRLKKDLGIVEGANNNDDCGLILMILGSSTLGKYG